MADMHTPLLPCPFCGGEAVQEDGSRIAECTSCYGGFYGDTEAEATAAWNRRSPSQDAETIKVLTEIVAAALDEWTGHNGKLKDPTDPHWSNRARAALAGSAS